MNHDRPFNRHGGLTLVPMPGFESLAETVETIIEKKRPTERRRDDYETDVDVAIPKIRLRPSLEPFVQLGKQHVGEHDCFVLTSGPGTTQMTMELIYVLGYLAARKAARITIVSGYFPLARSDKDEGGLELAMPPIAVRAMTGVSQGLVKRIVCVDPHSDQVVMAADPGVITPVYLTRRILTHVVGEARKVSDRVCLAFPDDTAAKRYEPAMGIIEREMETTFPIVSTAARRISGREKSLKYVVGDTAMMKDAIVIALDDEIATGGTQINAAKIFKETYGAREVWAAVTHGVLCDDGPSRFLHPECPIERLYISDTIPVLSRPELQPLLQSGRLHVMTWVDDLAEIIYAAHWSRSIRGIRGS